VKHVTGPIIAIPNYCVGVGAECETTTDRFNGSTEGSLAHCTHNFHRSSSHGLQHDLEPDAQE
jgi:hypothetical protein